MQFCTEDDKLLWDNSSVSSSCLSWCRMWHSEGMPAGHEHLVVFPFLGPEQGDGKGEMAKGSWDLPSAVAQQKEWDFLPKPGCKPLRHREDGLEMPGLHDTDPASSWMARETSCTYPAMPLFSISHLEPGGQAYQGLGPCGDTARAGCTPSRLLAWDLFHAGCSRREFPACNLQATHFMGCRYLTIKCFQATGGLSTNTLAPVSKPGHPRQH